MQSLDTTDLLARTGSKVHLDREKALDQLEDLLKDKALDDVAVTRLSRAVETLTTSELWQERMGALRAAQLIVTYGSTADFRSNMVEICLTYLEDGEVRVRLAVGTCLFALAQKDGVRVWEACQDQIMHSIVSNFEREDNSELDESCPDSPRSTVSNASNSSGFIMDLLSSSYRYVAPGTGELRHDTEGWKSLETSFKALHQIMAGCGAAFKPYIDDRLYNVLYTAMRHRNRFVRETALYVFHALCKVLAGDSLRPRAAHVAKEIALGLSDSWSQVRFAASVSARCLMEAVKEYKEEVFPFILPHICLNRYYVAEGVRRYNQTTWTQVMGNKGRDYVAQYAQHVVEYYISQCRSNNHGAREAACACIAEIMSKIDKTALSPHVHKLLSALIMCFKDSSWSVRDAACLAAGRGVLAYPEESRNVVESLYELWFDHLSENIPTVREDSALALGDVMRAYGSTAVFRVVDQLRALLPCANNQPVDTKPVQLSVGRSGVAAARTVEEDDSRFTNQQMFSCGSMAPTFSTSVLTKNRAGDCCIDYGFARKKEAWESSDGAVYLLRELSAVSPSSVPDFLPMLADIARLDEFSHAHNLQENIWKQLPVIANNMGKKAFKPFIELFLGPMFASLRCGHRNTQVAAGAALGAIRDMLGPNIFAGRLTAEQQQALRDSPDVTPESDVFSPSNGGVAAAANRMTAAVR